MTVADLIKQLQTLPQDADRAALGGDIVEQLAVYQEMVGIKE